MKTEITFDFSLGEQVYNRPADNQITALGTINVKYVVVSRIYEEIGKEGNGVVSYVVRHIDPTTPGGGKMFKFSQDELLNTNAFDTLMELKRKERQIQEPIYSVPPGTIPNYYGNIYASSTTANKIP